MRLHFLCFLMKTVHMKEYDCDSCDFKTFNKTKLAIHLQSHPSLQVIHVCDKCGQMFNSEHNLRNHRIMDHKDMEIVPSLIPCDDCDLFFEADELLKIHREKVHLGPDPKLRPYKYCGVSKKNLGVHERACILKDNKLYRDYQGSKLFQDDSFGWI